MNCEACRGACCETFTAEISMVPPMRDAQRWLELHAISVVGPRQTFECRCTMLTPAGRCSIWADRPMVCELFIAGGPQCLDTVRRRRTAEEYLRIRNDGDPETIQEVMMMVTKNDAPAQNDTTISHEDATGQLKDLLDKVNEMPDEDALKTLGALAEHADIAHNERINKIETGEQEDEDAEDAEDEDEDDDLDDDDDDEEGVETE